MVFLVLRAGQVVVRRVWQAAVRAEYGAQGLEWYRELYPKARSRAAVGIRKRERNEHNFFCVHKSDRRHGRP